MIKDKTMISRKTFGVERVLLLEFVLDIALDLVLILALEVLIDLSHCPYRYSQFH